MVRQSLLFVFSTVFSAVVFGQITYEKIATSNPKPQNPPSVAFRQPDYRINLSNYLDLPKAQNLWATGYDIYKDQVARRSDQSPYFRHQTRFDAPASPDVDMIPTKLGLWLNSNVLPRFWRPQPPLWWNKTKNQ
jgi:hypothetical protein